MKLREFWRWPSLLVAVLGLLVASSGHAMPSHAVPEDAAVRHAGAPGPALLADTADAIATHLTPGVAASRSRSIAAAGAVQARVLGLLQGPGRAAADDARLVPHLAEWLAGAEQLRSRDREDRHAGARRILALCEQLGSRARER